MKYIALYTETFQVGGNFFTGQSAELIEAEDDAQAECRAHEKTQGQYGPTSTRRITEIYATHHKVRI